MRLKKEEKVHQLEQYGIHMGNTLEKAIEIMYNLNHRIYEQGLEQGLEQGKDEKAKEIALNLLKRKDAL